LASTWKKSKRNRTRSKGKFRRAQYWKREEYNIVGYFEHEKETWGGKKKEGIDDLRRNQQQHEREERDEKRGRRPLTGGQARISRPGVVKQKK